METPAAATLSVAKRRPAARGRTWKASPARVRTDRWQGPRRDGSPAPATRPFGVAATLAGFAERAVRVTARGGGRVPQPLGHLAGTSPCRRNAPCVRRLRGQLVAAARCAGSTNGRTVVPLVGRQVAGDVYGRGLESVFDDHPGRLRSRRRKNVRRHFVVVDTTRQVPYPAKDEQPFYHSGSRRCRRSHTGRTPR